MGAWAEQADEALPLDPATAVSITQRKEGALAMVEAFFSWEPESVREARLSGKEVELDD
jgi:hypothetical protein